MRPTARPGSLRDKLNNLDGVFGWIWRLISHALEEGENYVVITLVGEWLEIVGHRAPPNRAGVGIGVISALMSIMTGWLSDIKLGRCTNGWWLSRKFCCLEITGEGESCAEWKTWGGFPPLPWIAYIIYAVS